MVRCMKSLFRMKIRTAMRLSKVEKKSIHLIKKIGRRTLSLAAQKSGGLSDPIKFNETIVISSFIEGDVEVKTTDEFINAAAEQLQEFIKQAEAKIKKL